MWGEEGQDWLHHPGCSVRDEDHHGGNAFSFPPRLGFSWARHNAAPSLQSCRLCLGTGLASGLLLGQLPAGSSPHLVSPATAHSQLLASPEICCPILQTGKLG